MEERVKLSALLECLSANALNLEDFEVFSKFFCIALSYMTNFRLFQTERVCRQ